jgi:hypothetical protein
MKKIVSMRRALEDKNLLGSILAGDSWLVWRVLLIALMGEELTEAERVIFRERTLRDREPLQPVEEFWGVVGRRGGKTRAMSVLATYLSALCDWRDVLVRGERGRLVYLASTSKQATIAFNYSKAVFTDHPLFRQKVASIATDSISLDNQIDLEVRAGSWRSIRGVTSIAAIFDELAFFMSEEHSVNTDKDILNAVRPSLATTGGPLIAISSPYAKQGQVYETVQREHHPLGDPLIMVARGASRDFNPSLPQRVVDKALQRDEAAARAEYLGEFREDIAAFVDPLVVQSCVQQGVGMVLPNKHRRPYFAFVDPSGGSSDSFTMAIAHDGLSDRELSKDIFMLDRLDEAKPPFRPEAIVARFADILRSYGVDYVYGDAYGGEWVRDSFERHGIAYRRSPLTRSELYLNFLPMLNSRSVRLLDHARLTSQLTGLQRRVNSGGRESVDHAQNSHDDVANAAAGALALLAHRRARATVTRTTTVRT